VAGIVFLLVVARRWLPSLDIHRQFAGAELRSQYNFHDRTFALRLPEKSGLHDRTLEESRLGAAFGLQVLAIVRGGRFQFSPPPTAALASGDRLLVQASAENLEEIESWRNLQIETDDRPAPWQPDEQGDLVFEEFAVEAESPLARKTPAEIDARRKYGVSVLAVARNDKAIRSRIGQWRFRAGDKFLVCGTRERVGLFADLGSAKRLGEIAADRLTACYKIDQRMLSASLTAESALVGQTLAESRLGHALGVNVMSIERDGERIVFPDPGEILRAGDRLLMIGRFLDARLLEEIGSLELEHEVDETIREFESDDFGFVEAILSPRTTLAGKTLRELRFRQKYGLNIVGVWRNGETLSLRTGELELRLGDALLLHGPREKIIELGKSSEFVVLSEEAQVPPNYGKTRWAVAALFMFLVPALLGWLPIYISALIGALAVVLSKCLTLEEAYKAVNLKVVVLIGGMLPLGTALQETGAATLLAEKLVQFVGPFGPMSVIGALFIFTSLATCAIPSAALVVALTPVAYRTALELGISPHAVLMALAMAAAGSFNSPIAHPSNLMIMGPGGYRFTDYFKVGIPLTLVVFAVVMLTLRYFWPL
jgi:di/tricarboxylate transporter